MPSSCLSPRSLSSCSASNSNKNEAECHWDCCRLIKCNEIAQLGFSQFSGGTSTESHNQHEDQCPRQMPTFAQIHPGTDTGHIRNRPPSCWANPDWSIYTHSSSQASIWLTGALAPGKLLRFQGKSSCTCSLSGQISIPFPGQISFANITRSTTASKQMGIIHSKIRRNFTNHLTPFC